jgi:hypothetical protein
MAHKFEYLNKYLDSHEMLNSKLVHFFIPETMVYSMQAHLLHRGPQKSYVYFPYGAYLKWGWRHRSSAAVYSTAPPTDPHGIAATLAQVRHRQVEVDRGGPQRRAVRRALCLIQLDRKQDGWPPAPACVTEASAALWYGCKTGHISHHSHCRGIGISDPITITDVNIANRI